MGLNLNAQKLSVSFYAGASMNNGFNENFYSNRNLDLSFESRLSGEIGIMTKLQISKMFEVFTGIDYSMYRYAPVTSLRWPSSAYENGWNGIGFNSNGLIENHYLSIPLGIASNIIISKRRLFPQLYVRINRSVKRSPLWIIEEGYNNNFFLLGAALGVNLLKTSTSRISVYPYFELRPKHKVRDHSYSDEKVGKIGMRVLFTINKKKSITLDNDRITPTS